MPYFHSHRLNKNSTEHENIQKAFCCLEYAPEQSAFSDSILVHSPLCETAAWHLPRNCKVHPGKTLDMHWEEEVIRGRRQPLAATCLLHCRHMDHKQKQEKITTVNSSRCKCLIQPSLKCKNVKYDCTYWRSHKLHLNNKTMAALHSEWEYCKN